MYRTAQRCVPAVQNCTSVCAACTDLHIGVCCLYRSAHQCVPAVQNCTSMCPACTDLHICMCSTQYRVCKRAYVRPKPKRSKVNPTQAKKVYGGCGCINPLALNLGCRQWWTFRLQDRLLYSSPLPRQKKSIATEWETRWLGGSGSQPHRTRTPDCSGSTLVVTLTELSWLPEKKLSQL